MPILETIEVYHPNARHRMPQTALERANPSNWVVPADWTMHQYEKFRVSKEKISWWFIVKINRIAPHKHYWPIRITTKKGRILFKSKAWKE